jgi:hypothetical protein
VIVLPIAKAPPAEVVKEKTTVEFAFPDTLSDKLMKKNSKKTESPIDPEKQGAETIMSTLVLTNMPNEPEKTDPIVNPLMVIPAPASAALAAMVPAATVITTSLNPGVATVKVVPLYVAVTPLADAKNEAGYIKVMVAPAASAPPAEVVNMRFAVQFDLPASRSPPLTLNTTLVTLSPMLPELTPSEAR